MMARASEAFQTISRGAYTGLATQPDKDNEILIALAADGGSKLASELSKGTRFQLYLALRVAGYHEFARTRRPVPFHRRRYPGDVRRFFGRRKRFGSLPTWPGSAK